MAERKFDDFDEYASDYRSIHTKNLAISGADSLYFAEHKVKQLMQYEINQPLQILDVGCGDGATELFIQKYFSHWMSNGIDISEKSIEEANNKNIPNTTFTTYDGESIPYENSQFDIVFIAAVLHHIEFRFHDNVMKEIYRVLKPGGRLYLFEHNPLNPMTRYLVRTCEFDKDARLLGYNYTKKLLEKSGFQKLQNKFIIFFPRKGLLSKFIGIEKYLTWLPLGGQYFFRAIR